MSLEQLSNIVITSVSRQEERLSNAPASLYIISADDIRRSGARSLPEALRLAPNLQVARVDSRNYAITARGFNNPFANKLLVLVDGRSIYSPLFSGVFWDAHDFIMADIARIEVISGPGATIWGANAVNGVINVITRAAADTQGGLVSGVKGEHEQRAALRYGGALANGGHYRMYAKLGEEDDSVTVDGEQVPTGWRRAQAGFRADWNVRDNGAVVLSGDAYQGKLAQFGTRDIAIAGSNLLARFTGKTAAGNDLRLQVILDHTERDQPGAFFERLNTLDLEAQHGIRIGERHKVIWGGGYRHAWDQVDNGDGIGFLPGSLKMHWANLFAQDEITLAESLRLTLGAKLEHNNYTGMETLPNLRLAWTPSASALVWTSISRTVRAPSRIDADLYLPSRPPIVNGVPAYLIGGGPDMVSEVAKVFELGYRAQPMEKLSYSVTAFYSDYDKLRTLEGLPRIPLTFQNMGEGRSHGVELWSRWHVLPTWRLNGGLVVQNIRSSLKAGSTDASGATGLVTNDPRKQWTLRSSHDLTDNLQLDLNFRHVDQLPLPEVPAYNELDLQLQWSPHRKLDVALIGQNLLHSKHPEFGPLLGRSVFERALLLTATFRF